MTVADDPASGFYPPELALASRPSAATAEKAYLYSLGQALLQGLRSTEEQVRWRRRCRVTLDDVLRQAPFPSGLLLDASLQEGRGPLLSLLSKLTAALPSDRPPLTEVLHACKLHSRASKPQVVLGGAVRRAVGRSSTVRPHCTTMNPASPSPPTLHLHPSLWICRTRW